MAVDQVLEIDLNNLTEASLAKLDEGIDRVLGQFENRDTRSVKDKFADPLTISKSQKEEGLRKIFGRQTFNNLFSFGSNPLSFAGGLLSKGIPGFGAAVASTAVIVALLKRFDDLNKKFTDQINTKLRIDRRNEDVARIQAGLQQEITTVSPGIYDPRDAYNTFNEFNNNRLRIETDYAIRTTSGVE